MAQLTLLPALHPRWCPGEGKPGGAGAMRVGYGCSPPLCPFSDARLPTARRDCKRDGWVVAGRVSGRHLAQQLLHSQHPCAENPQGGLGVLTDEELYVAPAVGGGYLNVDGAPGYEYEVPAREEKPRHGPAVSNPTFHPDGFDGFGGATSTDAYELIEAPAAPAVPVRRVESGAGSGGKEPKASTPRWMVVAVILALLLGVVAIAMGFLSGGSDSGGNTAPTTAPPTTVQIGASVRGPNITELAANLSLLQGMVQSQAAMIQSLQSQLNASAAPTFQPIPTPTHSPTNAPTSPPTGSPTNAPTSAPTAGPTEPPSRAPTAMPTQPPTPTPTDPPTSAPTAPTIAPTANTHIPVVVTSARRLGILLPNGTLTWPDGILGLSMTNLPLFEHTVEIRGSFSVGSNLVGPLSFPLLQSVQGTLSISDVRSALATIRFPVLHTIGSLRITGNPALMTLNGSFPSLGVVEGGRLDISSNAALTTLDGAFPALRTVGAGLSVNSNDRLAHIGTSFSQLTSVNGTVGVYFNAALLCSAYAPRLCPATLNWGTAGSPNSAQACCTQFCSTSSLC
eukprot:m.259346 g.259346  ORF g.259346 m.259346 type:complete len:565 (+) comp26635_c0_seq32:129-1823(+)